MKRPILLLTVVYAFCLFAVGLIVYYCTKDDKQIPDNNIYLANGELLLKARNNSNSNSAPLDSFTYVPIAYGAYMFSRLNDTIAGRGNTYLTHLRREAGICQPRRYMFQRFDVDALDTLPFRKSDSFFICRKVRI